MDRVRQLRVLKSSMPGSVVLVALLLVGACTSTPSGVHTPAAPPGSPIPAIGADYGGMCAMTAMAFVGTRRTTLSRCDGLVGTSVLPLVRMTVGEQVTIVGHLIKDLPAVVASSFALRLVDGGRDVATFRAVAPGHATLVAERVPAVVCVRTNGKPARSCPIAAVSIVQS
jgi:hypothetical protein